MEKKSLKKSLWKKSPTTFSLYFLGLFFWFDFIQKRPRKKSPILVQKARNIYQWMFTINHAKIGAIDTETRLDIFNIQMLRKKSFL